MPHRTSVVVTVKPPHDWGSAVVAHDGSSLGSRSAAQSTLNSYPTCPEIEANGTTFRKTVARRDSNLSPARTILCLCLANAPGFPGHASSLDQLGGPGHKRR